MLIVTNKAASVYAAIEKIAATASKIDKEEMIKTAGTSSPMFMKVVKAAYDPFLTYFMAAVPGKTPGIAPGANTLDEAWPWQLLDDMASRRVTGQMAKDQVQRAVNLLDDASAALLTRIIRKDLRAGFTDGTINRVFPKTLAEFPYMRCSLPDKSNMADWDWSVGIVSQEKADGMFANVNRGTPGQVSLTSRQGSPIPLENLPELERALLKLADDTQTHGELTVWKDGKVLPREVGNGMLNSVIAGGLLDEGCLVRYDAWDQIPMSAVKSKGKHDVVYRQRLTELVQQIAVATAGDPSIKPSIGVIPTRIVRSKAQAYAHYRELLKLGKEGTVCKHPGAIWKDGTSKDQVKLKLEVDVDLEVFSIVQGTPGTKNEGRPGSLDCRTRDGQLQTNVTVKNEKMRAAIEADPDSWIGAIMVVRANSVMAPAEEGELHSLFLPRFVEDEPRKDKAHADTLQEVQDQFINAVETA